MNFIKPNKTEKRSAGLVDLDFTVLNARETLPSKGKFYPDPYIYVRGLRFREQLEAAQIAKMEDASIALKSVYRLHSQCIDIPQVEFENILIEDLVALSMWVTFLTSSNTQFSVTAECNHCNKPITTNVNVSQLELKDFSLFELQTVDTEIGTLLIGPKTVGEDDLFSTLPDVPDGLHHSPMIKRLDGKDLTINERVEILGLLSTSDALKVINICEQFVSGLGYITKVCKECSKETRIYPYIDIIRGLP